jgi:hypothetical protein
MPWRPFSERLLDIEAFEVASMLDSVPVKKRRSRIRAENGCTSSGRRNIAAGQAAEASCKLKALSYKRYILSE